MKPDRHSRTRYRRLLCRARLCAAGSVVLLLALAAVGAQLSPPAALAAAGGTTAMQGVPYTAPPPAERHYPEAPLAETMIPLPEADITLAEPETAPLPEFEAESEALPLLAVELPEPAPQKTAASPARRAALSAAAPTAAGKGERTPAAYRSAPLPPYPAEMEQRRIEGQLRVRITVSATGQPTQVTIAQSSGHAAFDESTRAWILAHWLFTPAREAERAVASVVTTTVRFRLP